jgi:ArsR family transcriptional regulator
MIDASKLVDGHDPVKPSPCGGGPLDPSPWDAATLAAQAARYKALGDPHRLMLLHLIAQEERCVCDLVPALGLAQATLSHHLAILVRAGLATVRKEGRWNHHQATPLALALLASSTQAHPHA